MMDNTWARDLLGLNFISSCYCFVLWTSKCGFAQKSKMYLAEVFWLSLLFFITSYLSWIFSLTKLVSTSQGVICLFPDWPSEILPSVLFRSLQDRKLLSFAFKHLRFLLCFALPETLKFRPSNSAELSQTLSMPKLSEHFFWSLCYLTALCCASRLNLTHLRSWAIHYCPN